MALALGLGLLAAVLWVLSGAASPMALAQAGTGIIRVATTGLDAPGCGIASSPCRTLQYAVDLAPAGAEVRVAAGLYTGVRNVPSLNTGNFTATQLLVITQNVTIQGGYTASDWDTPDALVHPTTLDAQRAGRVLLISGDVSPTVEGLRITGGDATGLGGSPYGGADAGGGVYILGASARLDNNWIVSNTAEHGGGLFLWHGRACISGNTVSSNMAVIGGGLFLYDSPAALSANSVTGNNASEGGGLFLTSSDATLSGNSVTCNRALNDGGGVYLDWSDAALGANTITGNTAGDLGGGLLLHGSQATFVNDVIADNQAGTGSGLWIRSCSPQFLHTTIARNQGGDGVGIYITHHSSTGHSTLALTNTVLVSHTVGITIVAGNSARLEGTLWHGNGADWGGPGSLVTGTHNSWGDPRFRADGYHLMDGSPAIDRGVDAGVRTDIDGALRPEGLGFDLGADEFKQQLLYLPLARRK